MSLRLQPPYSLPCKDVQPRPAAYGEQGNSAYFTHRIKGVSLSDGYVILDVDTLSIRPKLFDFDHPEAAVQITGKIVNARLSSITR
jgi:hypothetical protein